MRKLADGIATSSLSKLNPLLLPAALTTAGALYGGYKGLQKGVNNDKYNREKYFYTPRAKAYALNKAKAYGSAALAGYGAYRLGNRFLGPIGGGIAAAIAAPLTKWYMTDDFSSSPVVNTSYLYNNPALLSYHTERKNNLLSLDPRNKIDDKGNWVEDTRFLGTDEYLPYSEL